MLENQANPVYLGIGSNLGNKKINIELAKFNLILNDVIIEKSSSYYESLSWPDKKNPKFYNVVLKVITNLSPIELINVCKKIETRLGRKKRLRNAPRECDIDIIDFNNKKMKGQLNLPHPRLHERNFVLLPLFEIDKTWKHPITKHSIKRLLLLLKNRDIRSIKKI
tara:strand:+ start:468 stop:965 length:498 start_codon:yes stop_codon:yes gene_type:complete